MAQIVTAQFVGQTSCGFVREKYYGQAALGGHDGLRLCLGVNAVCDCLIDDDLVVSHGENLQNIFY